MTSPDQIQERIERTRSQLSADVDRLNEKVSPGKIAGRRMDDLRTRTAALRDRVMGSSEGGGLRGAGDSLTSGASQLGSASAAAPQAIRNQAQGNPLAVGMIAFGIGWLLSSLAPASDTEQRIAAHAEAQVAEPLKHAAQDMAGQLTQPLQDSAQQLKEQATSAARDTSEQAKHAAQDIKQEVKEQAQSG